MHAIMILQIFSSHFEVCITSTYLVQIKIYLTLEKTLVKNLKTEKKMFRLKNIYIE